MPTPKPKCWACSEPTDHLLRFNGEPVPCCDEHRKVKHFDALVAHLFPRGRREIKSHVTEA